MLACTKSAQIPANISLLVHSVRTQWLYEVQQMLGTRQDEAFFRDWKEAQENRRVSAKMGWLNSKFVRMQLYGF